jgi:uncharacterized membrane protein
MAAPSRPPNRAWASRALTAALVLLSTAAIAPVAPSIWRYAQSSPVRLHAPDWALFAALDVPLKIHVLAALLALAIGCVIWLRPKGRGLHKFLGWTWVLAMAVTAVSSLFITGLNGDFYSFIHLLSGWTLIALPMAVFAIRRKNVAAHRAGMRNLFVGGLIVAGAFTFIPGRFMFDFLLG